MNTLVIQLPAQACAPTPQSLLTRRCHYMRLGRQNKPESQGVQTLGALSSAIAASNRVILLLAAVDVTLLQMNVPPLSASKLRAALPHLVEEQILVDATECAISCSAYPAGSRTVAVARRAWLTLLLQTLRGLGAQHIQILPSQTAIPMPGGQLSATLQDQGATLSVRLTEQTGIGLLIDPKAGLLATLRTLLPSTPITLFLDAEMRHRYSAELSGDADIKVAAYDDTTFQLPDLSLDLATGLNGSDRAGWNWRPWRWSLLLGALLLLTQTVALNLDWWRLDRESRDLRDSMARLYLAAYPRETVILDPLLQMQQKIAATRHAAGMRAVDDFDSLIAQFGATWSMYPQPTSITSMEYRDHVFTVHCKDAVAPDGIKGLLAQRGLELAVSPEDTRAWMIRSPR